MNESSTRRFRPRFHLLTALMVTLSAGILLGIELIPLRWLLREAWHNAPEVIGFVIAGDILLIAGVGFISEFMLRRRATP